MIFVKGDASFFIVCFQLFSYTNISPVNAMSGMISPTNLSMFTSPATTPRSTPRTTPVPRWNGPFITLDENLDYNMMAGLMPNTNTDPDGPHIIEAEGEIEGKCSSLHYFTRASFDILMY